jgi:hypothetical protein
MTTASSDWSWANTPRGMLVAFGEFLSQYGLIEQMMQVSIGQKTCKFAPQTKLVEFMAGIMSGVERLQDLSDGAQPVAKDGVGGTRLGSVGHWMLATREPWLRWKKSSRISASHLLRRWYMSC